MLPNCVLRNSSNCDHFVNYFIAHAVSALPSRRLRIYFNKISVGDVDARVIALRQLFKKGFVLLRELSKVPINLIKTFRSISDILN